VAVLHALYRFDQIASQAPDYVGVSATGSVLALRRSSVGPRPYGLRFLGYLRCYESQPLDTFQCNKRYVIALFRCRRVPTVPLWGACPRA
jgi:hypothetical protein